MLGSQGDQITIFEVVRAVDEPGPRVRIDDPLTASGRQLSDLLWQAIGDEVEKYLRTVTLADVSNCTLCNPVAEMEKNLNEIQKNGDIHSKSSDLYHVA